MSGFPSSPTPSLGRLAVALGRQWWPQVAALAAACGVVATTIGGSLAVGSALQRGLESLALARLGRIEAAVVGQSFFTAGLAERLAAAAADGGPRHLVPAIVMPVTVSAGRGGPTPATLLACDDPAALGYEPAPPPLAADVALVNGPLAAAAGLAAGDQFVVRLPRRSSVPADSPLGRRTGSSDGRRLAVAAILPDRGLGQFALRPVQTTEPLIVVPLETARRILRRPVAANAIFAVGMPPGGDAAAWLADHLEPTLADYGLALEPATTRPPSLRLTAERLILPAEVDAAAATLFAPRGGQATLVLLANAIAPSAAPAKPAASVPYSTVLGIEATSLPAGDLVAEDGTPLPLPADDGLIINRWLADDLAAQGRPVAVGDTLRLEYFEPETVHGRVVETAAALRISGIAAMTGLATAREVVPEVEGVTDEESIADWDPPFPFEPARVRTSPPHDEDDRYWKKYRATPKAFVTLATARRLAESRFGRSTAWLVPRPADLDPEPLAAELAAALPPAPLGLTVAPLLADALEASRGSTPFGSLFLALSSFVVAAGLLLEWLLFGLLVAAHRRDLGILAAVGWPPRRLTALLVAVGGLAAVIGGLVGTLLAAPWARLLLAALGSRWTTAVEPGSAADFLSAPPAPAALVAGGTAAVAVSLVALAVAARRAAAISPLALLRAGEPAAARRRHRRLPLAIAAVGLATALATALGGRGRSAEFEVLAFFMAGLAALVGLLAVIWLWLAAAPGRPAVRTLAGLARRNLAFAASRAFSVAAIVAIATFLIVSVSSFAQRPPADPADRSGPTGGWTEVIAFGEPTGVDPADPAVRSSLGLSSDQTQLLAGCQIVRLRSSGRDDAACTNLYATLQPTVLGVGPGFIARGGFSFAAHAPPAGPDQAAAANPWQLLDRRTADGPIPAILDQATAQWALELGGLGSTFTLTDDAGQPVEFEIVGLLEPGILQGFVIVAEREFERVFPAVSGYRLALVDSSGLPPDQRADLPGALTSAWADAGAAVTPAIRRLASLQAVQNTFLAGFQALGTLGLLLGTVGVAAVLLQGTFERLGALAVLRAVGFTPARVRAMLVLETVLMVVLGLAAGTAAALVAVAPALAGGQAELPVAWIAITSGLALAAAVLAATAAASQAVIPHRPPAAE
jgi:putative ABC transport system permease protein